MEVFSSCIRGAIIASPGKTLYVADYASIEVRVLFWLAGHAEGVKAYVENQDLYKDMATKIYNQKLEKITGEQRQVGKFAILGAGYGMGPDRFQGQCKQYGVEITEELAAISIAAYRETHAPVVMLWRGYESAARQAIQNPGKGFSVGKTRWVKEGKFLWCILPSGRKLAYYEPVIKLEKKFGSVRPAIYHYGVNPVSKKWELSSTYGGMLTENVTQATARDLMAEAMLRVEAAGYEIVLSVHDELLAEKAKGSVSEFESLMSELPPWASGCPIAAAGWSGNRYGKG